MDFCHRYLGKTNNDTHTRARASKLAFNNRFFSLSMSKGARTKNNNMNVRHDRKRANPISCIATQPSNPFGFWQEQRDTKYISKLIKKKTTISFDNGTREFCHLFISLNFKINCSEAFRTQHVFSMKSYRTIIAYRLDTGR